MLAFFTNPIIWAIITTAIGWKFFHYNTQLKDQTSERFEELRTRIEGLSTRESLYKAGLAKFLAWTDRFFEYGEVRAKNPSVLSASAYDRCLLMAVIYPFAAVAVGWLVFGKSGELGSAIGFADFGEVVPRILVFILLIVSGGFGFKGAKSSGWKPWLWLVAFMATMGAGVPLILVVDVPIVTILVISIAGVFGFTLALKDTDFGIAGTFVLATALLMASSDAIDTYIVFAVVFFVFYAVYMFVIAYINYAKPNLRWSNLAALSIFAFITVFISAMQMSENITTTHDIGLIVGLLLLPLVNVPFDFVSIALTRTLLRKNRGQEKMLWRLGYAGLDLVMALIFMVLLAIVMVICLQAFDSALGTNALGVRAVLLDIINDPAAGRHFWIYFALFSTLLPTMIHAVIGVSSLISFRLAPRSWVLKKINNLDDTARYEVASLLTLQFFASIALVALGAWGLLWLFGSLLGLSDVLLSFLLQVQAATEAILS